MQTRIHKLSAVLLGAAIVVGCDTSVSSNLDDDLDSGSADFTTFVTVGDSLTAGFADNAQYRDGQVNSYPSILADAFAEVIAEESETEDEDAEARVGGYVFEQPLMPEGATGSLTITTMAGVVDIDGVEDRLVLDGEGTSDTLSPVTISQTQSTSIDVPLSGPINNVGVPGAKFYHVGTPGYGNPAGLGTSANPFFVRFASSAATSMLTDATNQNPTFFVLWLGNNDVLAYATGGGTGTDQHALDETDVTTYGSDDITAAEFFATGGTGGATGLPSYPTVVTALKGAGAKGILINVPDVASIPYFTTVPYNPLPLDLESVTKANAGFAAYNAFLQSIVEPSTSLCPFRITQEEADRRMITFSVGNNPPVILDENLTDLTLCSASALSMRLATPDDLILLPTASKLGEDASDVYGPDTIWGVSGPLLDEDVLIDTEIEAVDTARMAINEIIEETASADPDIVLYDAAERLRVLADEGILYGTGGITADFVTGGAFSLDGVHPTARGYALIANEIRQLIEDSYGANLPPIDPGSFPTVYYQ